MFETLKSVFRDNWAYRGQISRLALFDLRKQTSNTMLSWLWLFLKPAAYIFCFWFALYIGLRSRAAFVDGVEFPYVLWLSAACIPWFFMSAIIGPGSNVFKNHAFLVNRVPFPMACIPSIKVVSVFWLQLAFQAILTGIYIGCGYFTGIYMLQVPLLLLMMFVFWYFVCMMFSVLSALSKDFKNLLGILSMPFFWLSGVIFNLSNITNPMILTALYFNPITFFVTSFRGAYIYRTWFWEDQPAFAIFMAVFLLTAIVAMVLLNRFRDDIKDVC